MALLDLRQAFYSVIREFVLGKGGTTPELQQVIDGLDPPPWLKQAMELIVNQPGFLARHQTDENLRFQLEEAHRHTFFQVRGCDMCAESLKGTRPGNGLADLIFNISFADALAPINAQLESEGFLL